MFIFHLPFYVPLSLVPILVSNHKCFQTKGFASPVVVSFKLAGRFLAAPGRGRCVEKGAQQHVWPHGVQNSLSRCLVSWGGEEMP